MSVREVDIDEAIRLRDAGSVVVDVREPFEWEAGHVAGAVHIPLAELPSRLASDLPDRSARSSSTADPARDPGARRSSWRPTATRTPSTSTR